MDCAGKIKMMANQVGPTFPEPVLLHDRKDRATDKAEKGKFHQGQVFQKCRLKAEYMNASYSNCQNPNFPLQSQAGPYMQ